MKKFLFLPLAFIASASLGQSDENPGSLWNQGVRTPFVDRIAGREGDIITILISEQSAASYAASTQTNKNVNNDVRKALGPILQNLIPNWGTGANSSETGQGTTTTQGRFQARMSAVVKKVLPNGNLVIEGTRWVKVNKDTQTFMLSGMIRRDDIRSDNTVLSEDIAEAEIRVEGKGAIADRQRRGIITRILDWLF